MAEQRASSCVTWTQWLAPLFSFFVIRRHDTSTNGHTLKKDSKCPERKKKRSTVPPRAYMQLVHLVHFWRHCKMASPFVAMDNEVDHFRRIYHCGDVIKVSEIESKA